MIKKSAEKILCVDDEENILLMFQRTIGRQYSLFTALSGESALDLLRMHHDFALIVADYHLSCINGVEFLKLAREISPNSVQIMLTGNIDLDVAIKTINETNIFRYLPKPCPVEVLSKVIVDALNQYRLIVEKQRLSDELEQKNQELTISNAALSKHKLSLEYELEMARIVYSKVFTYGHIEPDGLDYVIAAKETVGGDFLLTHAGANKQTFYLMLGDLTGHGLQSALAVILIAEIFDALCPLSPAIEDLAANINDKMCRKLPVGLFCAAILIKLDYAARQIQIWQGGLPEAFFLNAQGRVQQTLASNNLPLGVQSGQDYAGQVSCHVIGDAVSLFVYTDGVIEQMGVDQTLFGQERLQRALCASQPGMSRVDSVIKTMREHQQQLPQCDDISLFELHFQRISTALELL